MSKRKRKLIAVSAVLAIGAVGCSSTLQDLEGIKAKHPDKIEFYQSVDGYPNVGRICIDGVSFATTTRDYQSLERVPEWDDWCGGPDA